MHSYLKIYAPHSYTINKHALAMSQTEIWLKKSKFFFYSIATNKAHRKGLGLLNTDPRAFFFLGQLWVNTYKPKNVILISLNIWHIKYTLWHNCNLGAVYIHLVQGKKGITVFNNPIV